eukprot:6202205-Pleurochrysis_carterae.AAC.3
MTEDRSKCSRHCFVVRNLCGGAVAVSVQSTVRSQKMARTDIHAYSLVLVMKVRAKMVSTSCNKGLGLSNACLLYCDHVLTAHMLH